MFRSSTTTAGKCVSRQFSQLSQLPHLASKHTKFSKPRTTSRPFAPIPTHLLRNQPLRQIHTKHAHPTQLTSLRNRTAFNRPQSSSLSFHALPRRQFFTARSAGNQFVKLTPHTTPKSHSSTSSLITLATRAISDTGFGEPVGKPIPIPGTVAPKSPMKKLRRFLLKTILFSAILGGGALYFVLYLVDHLEVLMNFNIRFRGQSDIHYYATANRVNHRYTPQYTGDKVSDIKLLQAKLIRDVYKIYLSTNPLEKNMALINRYLNDQKVHALHDMASKDPALASEITEEVLMEAQYGVTLNPAVIDSILQNIFRLYVCITNTSPTHRQSVEQLHRDFEQLRAYEQDLQPMVEFVTVCLDAVVEGVSASPFKDPKKLDLYQPNTVITKPTY